MEILQNFRITLPFLLEVESSPPPRPSLPTCLLNMKVDYCGTYKSSKSEWNMVCVFLFCVKIFMQSTFTYTINLLRPNLFQSSNDTGCSFVLRHLMKSIFKHEEELNYFDKSMPLLTQNMIFEITSMS